MKLRSCKKVDYSRLTKKQSIRDYTKFFINFIHELFVDLPLTIRPKLSL